jgi:hypothetical protein
MVGDADAVPVTHQSLMLLTQPLFVCIPTYMHALSLSLSLCVCVVSLDWFECLTSVDATSVPYPRLFDTAFISTMHRHSSGLAIKR